MFQRSLLLPEHPKRSFFLWGPRQAGKSWLLRHTYPQGLWVDLLKSDEFVRYRTRPSRLRERVQAEGAPLVVVDEVQKVPELLDEVHWLIENEGTVFALCGSSARKVRRGHANLLGGRAIRYELFGLVSAEIGPAFDLMRVLNNGYLPDHYLSTSAGALLRSYVSDYLKEEVADEGLVRNLPAFSEFLVAAALADTHLVNAATIARDCGVSAPAVREYFQILVDTLLGRFLPAYRKRPKRRVIQASKFFFADVGVVNRLARRGRVTPRSEVFGKALENWVFHELSAYNAYHDFSIDLAYWRLASGIEVDFIIDDVRIAIEAKGSENIHADHLRGLRELKVDHPKVKRRIVVSMEPEARRTADGIDILPAQTFAHRLWAGEIV